MIFRLLPSVCFIILIGTPFKAHAYVDPGSGLLMLQMLIASLVGVVFYFLHVPLKIKKLFTWVRNKIRRKKRGEE